MEGPASFGNAVPARPYSGLDRSVSAAAIALLILFAGGGAAVDPGGVLLGVPSLTVVVVAILAGTAIWTSNVGALGGFLLPLAGLLVATLSPRLSALLLFSGRPLFVFAIAGAVLTVIHNRRIRPARGLLLPAFFAIYSAVAYEAQTRVGPDGDEPQYLMVAESLIRDHDLELGPDFKAGRYTAFFNRPLEPHFRIRGPEGQIYSLHAVGLSLLVLPAYALGGYPGASFFMALLAALLVRELRRFVMEISRDESLAEGTAWLVGLSPPVIHFAGLIFTEIPAALLVCVGLRAAAFGRSDRAPLVAALAAAALPWLNVRYAILSLAIVIALGAHHGRPHPGRSTAPWRRFAIPASILIGSAIAIGLYHFALWGFFDPRRVYGRKREFDLAVLPEGLPGLFFDQEFGLFAYAPVFVLALAGLALLFAAIIFSEAFLPPFL